MITAIVLASGFSRRMGTNKLLLEIDKKPIIRYILELLLKISFHDIILVSNNETVLEIADNLKIKSILNNNAHLGQSQSVKLGVINSNSKSNYMFFVGDMPFLNEEIINSCIECFKNNKTKIIIPTVNNNKKNPVIFPFDLREEILSIQGDVGAKSVLEKNINRSIFLEFDDKLAFKDIDTIEDYNGL